MHILETRRSKLRKLRTMVVLDYDSHGVPDVENRREIGKLNTWRKLIKGENSSTNYMLKSVQNLTETIYYIGGKMYQSIDRYFI